MQEILTVSQLTFSIKKKLEGQFASVTVQGEISNFKEQSSGHLYFTLKDAESQISAVLFKGNAKQLTRQPKGGDQVIVKGEISVYAPRGNYQIIIRELQYKGVGELLLKLHELKIKLEQKGWFDPSQKKPLPKHPKTIGVITSPTGSVIQDILNILKRRFAGFHLILNPVKVQGEGAALEIALAIEQFNRYGMADVLIVGRGGGSLEDLWAFNEEVVAEAIHRSKIPVISAVGHETDFCIADYVADLRAPTPSAAAELVTAEKREQLNFLEQSKKRLKQTLSLLIRESRRRLDGINAQPCFSDPYALLGPYYQSIDDLQTQSTLVIKTLISERKMQLIAMQKQALALKPTTQLGHLRQKIAQWEKALNQLVHQQFKARRQLMDAALLQKNYTSRVKDLVYQKKQRFEQMVAHLKAIDPRNLLTKGYCILFAEKKDSVILSANELAVGQKLNIRMHDGQIATIINDIKKI